MLLYLNHARPHGSAGLQQATPALSMLNTALSAHQMLAAQRCCLPDCTSSSTAINSANPSSLGARH